MAGRYDINDPEYICECVPYPDSFVYHDNGWVSFRCRDVNDMDNYFFTVPIYVAEKNGRRLTKLWYHDGLKELIGDILY